MATRRAPAPRTVAPLMTPLAMSKQVTLLPLRVLPVALAAGETNVCEIMASPVETLAMYSKGEYVSKWIGPQHVRSRFCLLHITQWLLSCQTRFIATPLVAARAHADLFCILRRSRENPEVFFGILHLLQQSQFQETSPAAMVHLVDRVVIVQAWAASKDIVHDPLVTSGIEALLSLMQPCVQNRYILDKRLAPANPLPDFLVKRLAYVSTFYTAFVPSLKDFVFFMATTQCHGPWVSSPDGQSIMAEWSATAYLSAPHARSTASTSPFKRLVTHFVSAHPFPCLPTKEFPSCVQLLSTLLSFHTRCVDASPAMAECMGRTVSDALGEFHKKLRPSSEGCLQPNTILAPYIDCQPARRSSRKVTLRIRSNIGSKAHWRHRRFSPAQEVLSRVIMEMIGTSPTGNKTSTALIGALGECRDEAATDLMPLSDLL